MSTDRIRMVERWLGDAWLCPDCGKVLRKPPLRLLGDRHHSSHCPTAMVRVTVDWHLAEVF